MSVYAQILSLEGSTRNFNNYYLWEEQLWFEEEKLKFHVIPSSFSFLAMCTYCILKNVNRTLGVIGLWAIFILYAFLI